MSSKLQVLATDGDPAVIPMLEENVAAERSVKAQSAPPLLRVALAFFVVN